MLSNTPFGDLHLVSVVRNGCVCCGLKCMTSMLSFVRFLYCPPLPPGLRRSEVSLRWPKAQLVRPYMQT